MLLELFITLRGNKPAVKTRPALLIANYGWRLKKGRHLPLDVVLPVENLLQECDESKRANEYETKRSIAEYVFPRRGVDICHPSAQHPGLTVTPAEVSLPAAFRTRSASSVFYPLDGTCSIALFNILGLLGFFLARFNCFHAAASLIRVAFIGGFDLTRDP